VTQLGLYESSQTLDQFFQELAECRDKNPLTHGLHPYPAKFIPHIPRALIKQYAQAPSTVLDPMCGSGTTVLEASLVGHTAIGLDLNPIAVLVSRSKTTTLSTTGFTVLKDLVEQLLSDGQRFSTDVSILERLVAVSEIPDFPNRALWFSDTVSCELVYIKRLISEITDPEARAVALCAFSAILVSVSNQESETRWSAKQNDVRPGYPSVKVARKIQSYLPRLRELASLRRGKTRIDLSDARSMPIASSVVNLVITSPPYANSHDYYLYNKLRLFWLGHDVRAVQAAEIGSRNRHSDQHEGIETYVAAMTAVLHEIYRVLTSNGKAIVVVADAVIRGSVYNMRDLYEGMAKVAGLHLGDRFEFGHKAFNASFQRGFGTDHEKTTHVLVFGKS
jgi:DNA modification methylase